MKFTLVFLSSLFLIWLKIQNNNLFLSVMKKAFKVKKGFFISSKVLSVARNFLWPDSAPLTGLNCLAFWSCFFLIWYFLKSQKIKTEKSLLSISLIFCWIIPLSISLKLQAQQKLCENNDRAIIAVISLISSSWTLQFF